MLHYNTIFGCCSVDGRSGLHSLPAAVPEADVPETSQWRQSHELPVLLLSARPLTMLSPFLHLPSFFPSFRCGQRPALRRPSGKKKKPGDKRRVP